MNPISGRRFATRFLTSSVFAAAVLSTGSSSVSLAPALAQAGARPDHERHGGHAGHAASAAGTPAVAEFKAVHADMMRGMDVPYTGDPDVDFRIQMIAHHQGAIDMAQVALRRARDPWTRQLAEAVIVEQQREIAEMRGWLAGHGIEAPGDARAQHVMTASSYRRRYPEAGSREEAAGASWAPASGAPAQR